MHCPSVSEYLSLLSGQSKSQNLFPHLMKIRQQVFKWTQLAKSLTCQRCEVLHDESALLPGADFVSATVVRLNTSTMHYDREDYGGKASRQVQALVWCLRYIVCRMSVIELY
jgi:hypothetical protein